MLKFFELEARFPRHGGEVPEAAVRYVAEQVKVDPEEFASYDWRSRSAKYHRAQVREVFGFREATRGNLAKNRATPARSEARQNASPGLSR